jgi:hypothetical protein
MGKKGQRLPKEYLGAFKCGHRKGVREYIDEEFSYELLEKVQRGDERAKAALEWITKYNNEIYRGVLKKNDPESIHNTPELYKLATDGHNARRRDLLSAVKSGKIGTVLIQAGEDPSVVCTLLNRSRNLNHEDTLIDIVCSHTRAELQVVVAGEKKKHKK